MFVRTHSGSNARTVQVDAAVGGGGEFCTAFADGSKVFFTKGGLYEFDVESGQTTDSTPDVEVAGVVGASETGEYIYYVDNASNLELWHGGGSILIATLSGSDGSGAGPFKGNAGERNKPADWNADLGYRTAEVTPDGGSMVFISNQSFKAVGYPDGYQNEGLYEVYTYEAESAQLICVSCNPSGEPPQRTATSQAGHNPTAAFGPISYSATYQPRWISDDGDRVFFDSEEALVPQDTNDKQDVYEWERTGTGTCEEADGCVYLLSSGTDPAASWLLDASASGGDVFIISRAELVPGDSYDGFSVYDARIGGVRPPAVPGCSGTGCQGVPPAPPIFATPASVTFNGIGNFPTPAPKPTVKSKLKSVDTSTKARKGTKDL